MTGHHSAKVIKQVKQVRHLDAAVARHADREQRSGASDLEFPRVEFQDIGIRRALRELQIDAVALIELLRLDDRLEECAQRRLAEDHHLDHLERRIGEDGSGNGSGTEGRCCLKESASWLSHVLFCLGVAATLICQRCCDPEAVMASELNYSERD